MKLNLPSADQHEDFFSDKSIERDLIAKHHLDNSFSLTVLHFLCSSKWVIPSAQPQVPAHVDQESKWLSSAPVATPGPSCCCLLWPQK